MASFFEPLPPRPPPPPHAWAAPAWDRPSEGTLPAILPVGEMVWHTDEAAGEIAWLAVYPNGFTIHLAMLGNPRRDPRRSGRMLVGGFGGHHDGPWSGFPRIGVRFADGRTAGQGGAGFGRRSDVDADGLPTEPILRSNGGGGNSSGYHHSVWVFPLPPDGPLEIFVAAPMAGVDEASVVVDGSAVRAAAARAKVIWS